MCFLEIPEQRAEAFLSYVQGTRSPALSEHVERAPDEARSAGAGGLARAVVLPAICSVSGDSVSLGHWRVTPAASMHLEG